MVDVNVDFVLEPDVTYTADIKVETITRDHDKLDNRDLPDQHPMGAITGLESALGNKQDTLTAGTGISIENNVISNTQSSVEWGNITGTLSNQTDLQTALNGKQDTISDLATIRSGAELGATAVQPSDLATVATSGSYNDLSNKPSIPTATSDLNNDSGFITSSALSGYATETWVGNQGYITGITSSDVTTALGYTPYDSSNPSGYTNNVGTVTSVNNVSPVNGNVTLSIPAAQIQSDWTQADNTKVDYIKNKPNLATVATSGSYNDLINKPSIPAAQVNSDWDAVSGVAEILNKPTLGTMASESASDYTPTSGLATVATSGDYTDLSNKPTIPTDTSDLTNGAGFITSSALSGYQTTSNLVTSVSSASTDSQYPSALCLYTLLGDIESTINTIRGV